MLQRVERRQVRPDTVLQSSSSAKARRSSSRNECVAAIAAAWDLVFHAVLLRALRRFSRRSEPQLPLQKLDAVHALLDLPDQIFEQLRELVVARRQEGDSRSRRFLLLR